MSYPLALASIAAGFWFLAIVAFWIAKMGDGIEGLGLLIFPAFCAMIGSVASMALTFWTLAQEIMARLS